MRAREGRGVVESGVAVVLVNHFQIHHYQPHPPLTRFLHSHPHTSSATLRRVCMSEGRRNERSEVTRPGGIARDERGG